MRSVGVGLEKDLVRACTGCGCEVAMFMYVFRHSEARNKENGWYFSCNSRRKYVCLSLFRFAGNGPRAFFSWSDKMTTIGDDGTAYYSQRRRSAIPSGLQSATSLWCGLCLPKMGTGKKRDGDERSDGQRQSLYHHHVG